MRMASTQLSEWNGANDRAPDELIIVLNNKLAEECEEHQALTKKLLEDNRMAVQSQLDDMRRTFQEVFDEHSRTTERLMDEQRRASEQRLWASEQRLQGVLQTCQRMEGQVEQARTAMQGALESVGNALQRERAQRQAELLRFAGGGPPAGGRGEPGADAMTGDCAASQSDASTQPAPTAGPPTSPTPVRPDADPARRTAALEARVAQLERLARAAESPDAAGGGPCAAPPACAGGGGSEPTATSAGLILVHAGFHAVCLLVALPALFLAVSAVMGAILAVAEDCEVLDGILYVGGNMVLINLTDFVPTTASGTLLDIMVSALSFALLGWGISIIGLLPFCPGTHALLLHAVRSAGPRHRRLNVPGSFVSVCLLVIALWPLACVSVSAVPAALLSLVEGWPYERSLLLCLGFLSHTKSLTPSEERPVTAGGKIMTLLLAFVAVGLTIGWMVGVCLQLPALRALVGALRRATVTRGKSLLDKGVNFFIVVFALVPLAVLPLSLVLGLLLNETEGWESVADSMLYVGGNLVGIPLAAVRPTSASGIIVDFFISAVGVGCFGFLVATVGSLDLADGCCECLGGKVEGLWPAVRFTMVFFLVVLPVTCAAVAVPLSGILSLAEGWSFLDGWLAVMSILVQAPSLAPPVLKIKQSDGGRIAVLLVACYALCVNIGWGAGLVVASKALDRAGSGISGALRMLKEATGIIDGEAQMIDGALKPSVMDA